MNIEIDNRPPDWFVKALDSPCYSRKFPYADTELHFLEWGDPKNPPLIFIHGGAAHARWWQFLAPFFAEHYHCLAPDLSGHGDSGHRELYPRTAWADELAALCKYTLTQPPILVGHSMGGLVAVVAAAEHPDQFKAICVIDSPIRKPDPESQARMTPPTLPQAKVYAEWEHALSRFRLLPAQPCENQFIVDFLARTSLKEVEGGWTWKFDPMVFAKHSIIPMHEYLARVQLPTVLLRGAYSTIVPPDVFAYMAELTQGRAPLIEIPEAHHHLILDQPLAFVAALRSILASAPFKA
ncbi:MAG: alpha/beta hydrolase [Acidobacteria bacterium]|nr:alpha/beta hydrolase [Acidobacteriota bacterium]